MRQNNYETDPYSFGEPRHAICSRGDLSSPPSLGGCYDTKVTSSFLVPSMTAQAINGPTLGDGSLPPFTWDNFPGSAGHYGQPDTFNFDFLTVAPEWF